MICRHCHRETDPPGYITLTIPLARSRFAYLTLPRDFTARDLEYVRAHLALWSEAVAGRPCPVVLRSPEEPAEPVEGVVLSAAAIRE